MRDFVRRATFDPRPTACQVNDPYSQAELNYLHCAIQATGVESVLLKHIPIVYEDGDYDEEVFSILDIQVRQFYYYLDETIRATTDPYLIPNTNDQSNSVTWMLLKSYLATASNAHRLLHLNTDKAKFNYLEEKLWNLKKFSTKGMKYGMRNESKAREAYATWIRQSGRKCVVEETGLWVKQEHPYLGCSPDGLVHIDGEPDRLLEIKCLQVLEKHHPKDFQKCLKSSQISRFPLKEGDDGAFFLKDSHPHYLQVQMQMNIMRVQTCDYFLWSPKGHLTVTVPYDAQFWEPKMVKIADIHGTIIIPEFFLQRVPRRLLPFTFEHYDEEDE